MFNVICRLIYERCSLAAIQIKSVITWLFRPTTVYAEYYSKNTAVRA